VSELSVYLDTYRWHFSPRSSDLAIVKEFMPQLARWYPDVRLVLQKSLSTSLQANYKSIRGAISRRLGFPVKRSASAVDYLDAGELNRSGCTMVFSHRGFPLNSGNVPVIWMHAIVDPEMVKSNFHIAQSETDEEIAVKGELFKKAAAVQVCSEAEAERHRRTYPDISDRFVPVPMFLPYLKSMPESIIEKHRHVRPIRLLFVANQPLVKGLTETLAAYCSLPAEVRKFTSLTIVSHFDRGSGRISVPNDPDIIVHSGLPRAELLHLMSECHILVNVAHVESYGLVFPEAMSRGMLCLGPSWEVQRELLDEGRAGMNLHCEVDLLRSAMQRAIEDEDHRIALATAALRRFSERYAPGVVAEKYMDLFRAVYQKQHKTEDWN
jgi:glycosyltransferase involved in cell wall biosynthesis